MLGILEEKMEYLTDRKRINRLIWTLSVLYMVSYLTRNNYSTVISTIITSDGITKKMASYALTASLATYGAGQVVSGFFGDRIQPRTLIFVGLLVTSCMNVSLPLVSDVYVRTVIWGINGLAQAFMWPPIVKIMSSVFDPVTYSEACVKVTYGSSVGTLFLYLCCPIVISGFGWKYCFFISAVCGFVMSAVILRLCPKIEMHPKSDVTTDGKSESDEVKHFPRALVLVTAFVMLAIVLQGALRDGVTTWMPSFVKETFHLGDSVSILTGVLLPIFSMFCFNAVHIIYRRFIRNELLCTAAVFCVGGVAALLLSLVYDKVPILAVLLIALLVACMHGTNLMLVSIMPAKYKKFGNISFISGLLNSCTYIGSALSTWGFAVFSDHFGWRAMIILWFAIAAVGTTVCALFSHMWNKTTSEN